jgi:NAD+ kinase
MRLAFHANAARPRAIELARRGRELLAGRAELFLSTETAEALGPEAGPGVPLEALEADVLVAFGGDGTFLTCFQRTRLPVLTVNAGTVGFLAEVEGDRPEELTEAFDRLLAGRYTLESRMRIATEVDGSFVADAINEVVVHSSQVSKVRLFEIAIEDVPLGRVRADGIIVATPTGSTSYALAAMGPIVDPNLEAMIVTALAPFPPLPRAVVLDPMRPLAVRLVVPGRDGLVVIDGRTEVPLRGGATVLCYRSPRPATVVRLARRYFQKLRGKNILPWPDPAPDDGRDDDADLPSAA